MLLAAWVTVVTAVALVVPGADARHPSRLAAEVARAQQAASRAGKPLLVVFGAFSEAVNEGLWHQIPLAALGGL